MKRWRFGLVLALGLGASVACEKTEAVVLGHLPASGDGEGGGGGSAGNGDGGSDDGGRGGDDGDAGGSSGEGGEGGEGGDDSCPNTCEKEAEVARRACIAEGTPEAECHARFERQLTACLSACAARCRERCDANAGTHLDECLASDSEPAPCIDQFVADATRCRTNCDIHMNTECALQCATESKRAFNACLEGGVSEPDCALKLKSGVPPCLLACEVDPCAAECEKHATEAFEACLAEGLPEADCEVRRKAALDSCLMECPDRSCQKDCESKAEKEYRTCVASGTDELTCRKERQTLLETCLEGCPPDAGARAAWNRSAAPARENSRAPQRMLRASAMERIGLSTPDRGGIEDGLDETL